MNDRTNEPVRIASKLLARGAGLAPALVRRAATVSLDWDSRQKSRLEATDDRGVRVAIFLPRGTVMRGGDVLVCDDGALLIVHAAPQALMGVRSAAIDGLVRAAYHLGNRHVPVDIRADSLRFEPDHVLADMLRGMGFDVAAIEDGFEPEGGAYHTHGAHAGSDAAGHRHGAHQHHEHGHEHEHGHGHGHVHDESCAHDHGSDHGQRSRRRSRRRSRPQP